MTLNTDTHPEETQKTEPEYLELPARIYICFARERPLDRVYMLIKKLFGHA